MDAADYRDFVTGAPEHPTAKARGGTVAPPKETALTPPEQRVAKTWLEPLRASNRRMYTRIKKMTEGTDIDISDLDPTHMPRLAVGHTPELDQAAGLTAGEADPVQGGFFGRGLTKKTTTLEAPKYVTLVGENGSRTIVNDLGDGE